DHDLVLEEDAKMVPHRRVVQAEDLRELLCVPRFFPDCPEHLPADRSADAAPEKPPQQTSEAVHAASRSHMSALSSTFSSVIGGDRTSADGEGCAWSRDRHGCAFRN